VLNLKKTLKIQLRNYTLAILHCCCNLVSPLF